MKKRLLLLSAILAVSVNSIFAQLKTVYSGDNNITYTYSDLKDVKITEAGQTDADALNNLMEVVPGTTFQIRYVSYVKTSNRTREINLTVSSIEDYSIIPNTLASFNRPRANEITNTDLNAKYTDFATRAGKPSYAFTFLGTDAAKAKYKTYCFACDKAISLGENVKYGNDLIEEGIDEDAAGRPICDKMYYFDEEYLDEWTLITRTTGYWKEGNTFENCTDIFIPTSIGANITLPEINPADDDNKVGIVTGLIDTQRFNSILSAKNYLNYDFTNACIVGTIKSSSVSDNYLAYFRAEANAEGANIINGTVCENYNLADDGTEIKVYKPFNAKNIDYTRNITAGNYYTITVPFNFQNKSDYFNRTSTFTSCTIEGDKTKVKFTLAEWEANMPMLCKANTTTSVLSLSSTQGIEVKKSIAKSWGGDELSSEPAKFNGNYEAKPKAELADAWIVGLSGTFGRMPVNSTQLKPGRAYITLNKYSAAKLDNAIVEFIDEDGTVEVLEVNGETTGIDGIDGIADSSNEVVASQFVTLDGKVSTTPVKGLNIVKSVNKNGQITTKKVVY